MIRLTPLFLLPVLLGLASAAVAQNPGKAPAKSGQCTACHGADGQSRIPANPILRCQHQAYLASALRAYRSGSRKHPVMNSIANTLQPKDIQALSAWYANQPGCRR